MITSQTVLPGQQENFLLFVATNNVDRVKQKYGTEEENVDDNE